MWILCAFLSAIFAGFTAILAKIGLKDTDSTLATAMRTLVVLAFSLILVFTTGTIWQIGELTLNTLLFLILSGLSTGASWLCYFKALQMGDVNKVVPIDKASTILSMIFGMIILGETGNLAIKIIGMLLIATGTILMLLNDKSKSEKINLKNEKDSGKERKKSVKTRIMGCWWFFAGLSAVFAALTSILGKIGIQNVDSNLGTTIRTAVVLVMAWLIVFWQKKQGDVKVFTKKSWIFIVASGVATGLSWLFYYRALQMGEASIVVPIDKLSIIITVLFGFIVLKEKMTKKAWQGLSILTLGTLVLLLKI